MLKCLQNLLVEEGVILLEVVSSLGVADDDIAHAGVHKHGGSNLSGIGPLLLDVHVLSADLDIGPLDRLDDRDDIHRRNTIDHIHVRIGDEGF